MNNSFSINHVVSLEHLGRFKSYYDRDPKPVPTEKGYEKIEFLIGGGAYFEVNGKLKEIGAGAILWHHEGDLTVHKTVHKNPYECLSILFKVKGKIKRQVPRYSEWESLSLARDFAHSLLQAYHRENYDSNAFCQYIYSTFLWKTHLYSLSEPDPSLPKSILKVMSLIDENFGEPMQIEDFASVADISAPHLHFLFKKHLKTTPYQHLLERRIQASRNFLVTTDLQVKEICFACGFSNVANFCRAFKIRFTMTPGQFRKKHSRN